MSTSSGFFNGVGSRRTCHSGGLCGGATALSGGSPSNLIFASGRRIPTRAPTSMRSGHCTGGMESSEEITKSLLFLLPNGLADPLGVELLEL